MNPFCTLEISAALLLGLALVLFVARPAGYPTPFALLVLASLAVAILVLDQARRRW